VQHQARIPIDKSLTIDHHVLQRHMQALENCLSDKTDKKHGQHELVFITTLYLLLPMTDQPLFGQE
jgi:hypothetical protein